jgi:hypothetical protein
LIQVVVVGQQVVCILPVEEELRFPIVCRNMISLMPLDIELARWIGIADAVGLDPYIVREAVSFRVPEPEIEIEKPKAFLQIDDLPESILPLYVRVSVAQLDRPAPSGRRHARGRLLGVEPFPAKETTKAEEQNTAGFQKFSRHFFPPKIVTGKIGR